VREERERGRGRGRYLEELCYGWVLLPFVKYSQGGVVVGTITSVHLEISGHLEEDVTYDGIGICLLSFVEFGEDGRVEVEDGLCVGEDVQNFTWTNHLQLSQWLQIVLNQHV
jgi:hypothetical protein